ncbi:HPr(Ser) kinase/phosphatase [bacterium F11]|nr:HPr(Ser) kinase/phosphatase [bacterium F11]
MHELFESCKKELNLEWVAGHDGGDREVKVIEVNRPGLSLAGYFEYFRAERIQIVGLGEFAYLQTLDIARRLEMTGNLFGFKELPCVIITHGKEVPPEMLEEGNRNNVPVFRTNFGTAHLIREMTAYLENRLAPMKVVHGVLTVVYGLGLMIIGDSGSGKSECGLELVKRGHMLVSDDYVEVRHHPGDVLIGSTGPNVKHFIEVRGLGLIDVKHVFGIGAVKDSTKIELIVRLTVDKEKESFDRIGLENRTFEILGVHLPEVVLPLRPGRNVAVLMEVAALNHRLKQSGIFPARELNEKLIHKMAQGGDVESKI